ncbi:adenosylcobinamide amidohydrolase [Asanoa iriomotensis]|uniref:Adenosylcobinamide amidohydrolase n=1 Tax=Asanoa iriomotensis TaxID=234613 RepID=A0ABQ4C5L9_9ACTN|nr:adenosylcobinamide amidohydrolase [Asanoa iriomotensis]GIF58082.1 adenosylcobinamide amidohydrolase [Asanoa iriomotensis]
MPFKPILTARQEDGESIPLLLWRLPTPMRGISSGPLGGGIGDREWVINATVPMSYARNDPHTHLRELASELTLTGPGVGLLTGVDVTERVAATDGAVEVWATVGLGKPILAAATPASEIPRQPTPGTINIVAFLPVRHSDAALVNAVATITEAKAQALWEIGLAATGTATDAVTVLCPREGPEEPYGGPLSRWGSHAARAAHRAIKEGATRPKIPWSER